MGTGRRAVIGWISCFALGAGLAAAPAAAAPITIPDPVGDSTAATCSTGCPDISAVHVSEAGGRIIVTVESSEPWHTADADVTLSGDTPFGGVGARMYQHYPGPPPYERSVDGTRFVYSLDPAVAFMRNYPLELRVRAKATSAATIGTAPTEYDAAPDAGEATYQLDNRDGDGVPDIGDPCPDAAEAGLPAGWEEMNSNQFGCPGIVPFARDAFVAEARKTRRALLTLWRNPARRAAALRRGRLTVPFRVPAGVVDVRMLVFKTIGSKSLFRFSVATRFQSCPAGRCRLAARVYPRNVRRLAGKRVSFLVGVRTRGRSGVFTEYRSSVRLRAG